LPGQIVVMEKSPSWVVVLERISIRTNAAELDDSHM